ncbi:MAG: leucine-rich repeat domain-containing protein [Parachlamydiales bacterium]
MMPRFSKQGNPMTAQVISCDDIPNEVLSLIMFNSLDGSSLLQSRLVSCRWKMLADDVIKRLWGNHQADPGAIVLGLDVKMRALQAFIAEGIPPDNEALGYLLLFRRLHDHIISDCKVKGLPRFGVIQAGIMPQLHQYFKNQALLMLWEQIRGIIDPRPHQVQILPPLSTSDEVREWISDVRNAPLLTMVEVVNLNGKGIFALPDEIGLCTSLKALHLASNRLRSLPAALVKLTQLQVLDLRFNQFTVIPSLLQQMPANLRYAIDGNPIVRNTEMSS